MSKLVPFRRREYVAKQFYAGPYTVSGTICGSIDITDGRSTCCLTPDEVADFIAILHASRADVLANSEPLTDPRIIAAS